MHKNWKMFAVAALCCHAGLAQTAPPVILEVDVENRVNYTGDISDPTKFASDANQTTAIPALNFRRLLQMGDIVAVNGKPVRGVQVLNGQTINLATAPNPGQAISDTSESLIFHYTFQFLQPDGTPIGSITTVGLGGGDIPPGAPPGSLQGDAVVVGGTGAFLGARGQSIVGRQLSATRNASLSEDPANRRRYGGGAARTILQLIPMTRPEIMVNATGPMVVHGADSSPVTAAKPARAGETLIVTATNLGPTRPGVDPGKPFPADGFQEVNSPLDVTVNGQAAEVLNKIGWPGQFNVYRIDIRVPDGIAQGTAVLQLTEAWIAGPEVRIPVQ